MKIRSYWFHLQSEMYMKLNLSVQSRWNPSAEHNRNKFPAKWFSLTEGLQALHTQLATVQQFVFSGTVFERNRSTFKISLSFGIHTRNRFSPHKHVRVISNYGFLKSYTADFFGFCSGLVLTWTFLLLMLPFIPTTLFSQLLFYIIFPLKIYLYRIFNGSVLLRLRKTSRTNKKKEKETLQIKKKLQLSQLFLCLLMCISIPTSAFL